MRHNFVEDPIRWEELPPVERLRTMIDWFDDFEPDDVVDASDEC